MLKQAEVDVIARWEEPAQSILEDWSQPNPVRYQIRATIVIGWLPLQYQGLLLTFCGSTCCTTKARGNGTCLSHDLCSRSSTGLVHGPNPDDVNGIAREVL